MQNKKVLATLIANLFLVFVGIGLVVPVMPVIKTEMGLSGTTMGMLVSFFSVAQLLTSPIVGRISDKSGRKNLIILGMVLYSVSEFIFATGMNVWMLYLSRIIGGIAAAMIMPSITSFAADITSLPERPKVMGWISAAISGGFIIGPGLGGLLAGISDRMPFFVAGFLGVIGCIFAVICLKEEPKVHHKEGKVASYQIIWQKKYFLPFLVILISSFGLAAFEGIYGIFMNVTMKFTPQDISFVVVISGLLALVFQLFLFDFLIRTIGEIGLIRLCFLASAIFVGTMLLTHTKLLVMLATFVVFLAFDLVRPAITTYLSKGAGENQGLLNGMNSSLTSVGNIVGPFLAGVFLDINYAYPYIFVFLVLTITFGCTLFWKKEELNKIES